MFQPSGKNSSLPVLLRQVLGDLPEQFLEVLVLVPNQAVLAANKKVPVVFQVGDRFFRRAEKTLDRHLHERFIL